MNLFVSAENAPGRVVGRVFTDGVRTTGNSTLHAHVIRPGQAAYRSVVRIDGSDVLPMVQQYYDQSEQLPARYFSLPEDRYGAVVGLPGCDEPWLRQLTGAVFSELPAEKLRPLETRAYRFECGCTAERIFPALESIARRGLDELFAGDDVLRITCPRCAATYNVTRDELQAYLNR